MKEKRLSGKALAAKLEDVFSRIEAELGVKLPHTVTVLTKKPEFRDVVRRAVASDTLTAALKDWLDTGDEAVPGVEVLVDGADPVFIADSDGMTGEEADAVAEISLKIFRENKRKSLSGLPLF